MSFLIIPQSKQKWSVGSTLFVAVVFYSFASYYLVYCIHHDEHFQILEFANFKRGLVGKETLAWEYNACLRPSIQPAMAYILLNFMELVNLTDPFDQAFMFRLISSIIFLHCSLRLYRTFLHELHSGFFKNVFFFLSFFLYTFPISGTRFSSENMSSCLFATSFAMLYTCCKNLHIEKIPIRKLLSVGAIFGLSFLFRYQSALLIVGLASWLLVYHHKYFKDWLIMFAGFCLVVLLGTLLDFWFYDKWVFTPFNYLKFNIIDGGSKSFGVSPWYFYFTGIDFRKWLIVLNLSILFLIPMFLFIMPSHPINWIFFPFLIIHCIIAHKETRFLYPILLYLPFMVSFSIQFLVRQFVAFKRMVIAVVVLLLVINSFAFVVTTFSVTDNSTEIFKFIRTLPKKPVKVFYENSFFFYTLNDGYRDITPHFYKDDHVISMQKAIVNVDQIAEIPVHADTLTYIILDKDQQEKLEGRLKPAFDPQPAFLKYLNYRNWMKQGPGIWILYELQPRNAPQ